MNNFYESKWKAVEAAFKKGLDQTAEAEIAKILAQAKSENNTEQILKALCLYRVSKHDRDEKARLNDIALFEKELTQAKFPLKQLLHSMLGELYWTYYQEHRWMILDRTNLSEDDADPSDEPSSISIETWTADDFYKKAAQHYQESLHDAEAAKIFPLKNLGEIIDPGKNTQKIRPTLYDFLLHRSIGYFSHEENDLTKPAYAFAIKDENAFKPAADFVKAKFQTSDTNSQKYNTLIHYQQVLKFHLHDADPQALIDADIARIKYVNQFSTLHNKKELYLNALKQISMLYPNNEQAALATYYIAENYSGSIGRYDHPDEKTKKEFDLSKAKDLCLSIVEKFPNSEAAYHATLLMQQIETETLSIETEKVVLPGKPSLAKISYRNIKRVYARIVKLTPQEMRSLTLAYENRFAEMQSRAAIKNWQAELPNPADYLPHTTEIKIDALPLGSYALIVSSDKNFSDKENTQMSLLSVSDLAYITETNPAKSGTEVYVMHRESGKPMSDIQVKTWMYNYNYATRKNELTQGPAFQTNEKGAFSMYKTDGKQSSYALEFIKGNDDLFTGSSIYIADLAARNDDVIRTVLFTDRSIYRPGQTIYFKGIMIREKKDGSAQHSLMTNHPTNIVLKDANYEDVKTLDMTTNEFGSFNGTFTAPEGLLTGTFYLQAEGGNTEFNIEEYKRPKFDVNFDTLKGSYKANDEIMIRGMAKAFAGNNIDGANVKYRVVRKARFPYYWSFYRWGQPASADMEITNGNVKTTTDGSFNIRFKAIPDETIDRNTLPVFDYYVYADVTDINGETRSGSQLVSVSYRSLLLRIETPESADFNDFNALQVFTTNMAGTHIPVSVELRCKKLLSPAKTYRKRLWEKCEINSIPEVQFRKDFPLDEYNDENNHLNWPEEKTVWSKTITTKENGVEYLQKINNEEGWYVIEATTRDKDGEIITDKKYIRLSNYNKPVAISGEPLLISKVKTTAQPGEKAKLGLAVPFDNIYLLTNLERQQKIKNEWVMLSGNRVFDFNIEEADRGGFAFSAFFVKDNRYYEIAQNISVPWTNKQLQLTLETFRDKILPGSEQEWKIKVSGYKKEKVSAELLTTLYDASLDAFRPHTFDDLNIFENYYRKTRWNHSFDRFYGRQISYKSTKNITPFQKQYAEMNWWGLIENDWRYRGKDRVMKSAAVRASRGEQAEMPFLAFEAVTDSVMLEQASGPANAPPPFPNLRRDGDERKPIAKTEEQSNSREAALQIRSNFSETAFFFPQLQTDKEGNIIFSFKAPDALTRWNLLAFAHTRELQSGLMKGTTITQKDLMIVPNTPRFLREGDHMVYSAKVTNLSQNDVDAEVTLQLADALTEQYIDSAFNNAQSLVNISIKKGESRNVSWNIDIPQGFTNPVKITTIVKTPEFSDGEQNVVPVLLNSMLVTETLPLPVRVNSSKTFTFKNLLNAGESNTLRQYNLSVEYTGNPAWYAVQALPYLTEYPYECAEQTFNRYYANVLATHIANASPRVKEIFATWQDKDSMALLSNLEKNQELKSALLQDTPWVLEAKNETAQKKNIATLFNLTRMSRELERTVRELELMQSPNGGFTWFKGMPEDRFMTQYILTGIGRLMHIGVTETGNEQRIIQIVRKAIPYLDTRIKDDYEELIQRKYDLNANHLSNTQIQYLYMRSFYKEIPVSPATQKAFDYFKKQASQYWLRNNRYMQGMIALALKRWSDGTTAKAILKSLRENAIHSEEMGMYWKEVHNSYWWYEAPIETQSLLVEAFKEVDGSEEEIDEMKIWLLKNKQTQNWATTKSTADAVYALLLNGSEWLSAEPEVTIRLGSKTILSKEQQKEAGTGYFKANVAAEEISPAMGNITVQVKSSGSGTAWGAVYWQYFENLDKIKNAETPLIVKRQLFVEKNSDKGPVLVAVTKNTPLQVGDKVKVRIELQVDRDMEYVHMKDMRASCFEPINVLSNYKYQGGLGYYEATKDAATNFFFNWLSKGTYIFEYPMFVSNKGDYSNGICTIQCMYAPEFNSHSEGIRVTVK